MSTAYRSKPLMKSSLLHTRVVRCSVVNSSGLDELFFRAFEHRCIKAVCKNIEKILMLGEWFKCDSIMPLVIPQMVSPDINMFTTLRLRLIAFDHVSIPLVDVERCGLCSESGVNGGDLLAEEEYVL